MRFALLDPLRGVAAVWVLFVHYRFSDQCKLALPYFHNVARAGELGVAMFFVISGYCLAASASSAMRKGESSASFLQRRLRRIYPPLWASMFVVCTIPFVIEGLSSLKSGEYIPPSAENPHYGFLEYSTADWLSVATLTRAFRTSDQTIGDKFTSINAVYWSLAIEVQFYLVITLGVLFRRHFWSVIASASVVAIPFSLVDAWYRQGIFLPWWPMFGWGVLLFYLLKNDVSPSACFGAAAHVLSRLGVATIFIAVIALLGAGYHIAQQAFAPIFALLLWFAWTIDDSVSMLRKSTRVWVRWPIALLFGLGLMSYSVYLIHGRLQYLVLQISRQILDPSIASDVAVISITIAACIPFYYLFERPFVMPRVQKKMPVVDATHSELAES